jgi:gamma-glutamyltranspeptidase/glutathione hydrolase
MVVSAHPIASEVGIDIINKGGNAADAAIAVQMALAVVYPSAGNIGGGGFLVYRNSQGFSTTLDFREKAPLSASPNMYLDENKNVIENKSLVGHSSAGVPGTVDGMVNLHEKYGSLPWEVLIQPAIDLATNGFALTKKEAYNINYFNSNKCVSSRDNNPYYSTEHQEGDSIFLLDLASTLIEIKNKKRNGFYAGKVADYLVEEVTQNGGLITHEDLINYKSIWRDPVISNYKNFKLISMGPPSSGGILLAQMMKMAEHYPIKEFGFHSSKYIHLLAEIERRAFSDRSKHLGDPDFYNVLLNELIDSMYLVQRIKSIDIVNSTPSNLINPGHLSIPESEETTHFSIVDNLGNAASVTTTLNGSFGSGVVVKNAGFILNNEMDDFSVQPGYPNLYGLIGGLANAIEPEKRMLSSMTPTILEKDNELFMVLGSPGGSTIITAVFQTILNVIEHNMSIDSAVTVPRFHHQWLPDQIRMEKSILKDSLLITQLKKIGHNLKSVNSMNRVDAILIENNKLYGGADPRGDDYVAISNKIHN